MGLANALWATVTGTGVYSEGPIATAQIPHDGPDAGGRQTRIYLPEIPNVLYTARAVLGDNVVMRRVLKPCYMPWDDFPLGWTMPTREVLGLIGEDGYPGFDAHIKGISIWRRAGRWGRPVYAILPDCGDDVDTGYIEVSPSKKQLI